MEFKKSLITAEGSKSRFGWVLMGIFCWGRSQEQERKLLEGRESCLETSNIDADTDGDVDADADVDADIDADVDADVK